MSGPTDSQSDDSLRTDGGGATRGTRDTSSPETEPEPVEPDPTEESGPNLAAFLLTAGSVTAVFVAIFVFAFPEPINQYFAGIVLAVTVITLIVGMVLDLLGYFGDEAKVPAPDDETASSEPTQLESVRRRPNKPLPKQVNFDDEIRELRDHFGGDLPEQMDAFLTEYEKLKSSSQNRKVVAGSLRAALNPIAALVTDEETEEMVDEMGDQLFAYIKADPVDNMVVTEHAFYTDGVQTPIADLQTEQARIKATVHNKGDSAKAEVAVRFKNEAGVPVKTAYLPVGEVVTEARKELNTSVYVPSLATAADVFVVRATQDTPVLDM